MERYHAAMSDLDQILEKAKSDYPILKRLSETLESTIGISTRCFVLVVLMAPIAWFMKLEMLKCCLLSFCMFRSVTAIERGHVDRTRWLMYWLIFYSYELFESSPVGWATYQIVPLSKRSITYAKLGVYIWCASPKHNGCDMIYQLIRPVFLSYVGLVDKNIDMGAVSEQINSVVENNTGFIVNQALNAAAVVGNERTTYQMQVGPQAQGQPGEAEVFSYSDSPSTESTESIDDSPNISRDNPEELDILPALD